VRAFGERRAETVRIVEGLDPAQIQTPFHHPEQGPMTLFAMLDMMIGHDLHHMEHLARYLDPKTASTW
jgi:hypothetical protein